MRRLLNMLRRRGHAWPSRLEAGSRHGLVPVLILGRQKDGPLLNSDGGEVRAAQGRVDRSPEGPRPPGGVLSALAKPRPHRSRRAPSVVARSVPRDLGGHTAGDVVRQASDDDRDGGNVLGALARHGQHGVVLAAPGRQVRPGSFWAELPCPLKAATVPAVAPGPGLARRRRARSAVTMR